MNCCARMFVCVYVKNAMLCYVMYVALRMSRAHVMYAISVCVPVMCYVCMLCLRAMVE